MKQARNNELSELTETIAANHLGLKVAAVSCVTNQAAGLSDNKLDHDDIKIVAKKAVDVFANLLSKMVIKVSEMSEN